jgi:hypothetical protein
VTRYRRNVFLARPTEAVGPATHGVVKFPGFHTASDKDTTYAYAQIKVVHQHIDYDPDESLRDITLDDYPVVIALDMSGMKAKTDFDAVETVRPALVDVAKQVVGGDEMLPLDQLTDYVEGGDYGERQMPNEAYQWLFEYGSSVVLEPASALLMCAEAHDNPNDFIRALADGSLPDDSLAEITGQFRYTSDVPADRVVEAWYVQPWWPNILETYNDKQMELAEQLEALNWSVIMDDDVLSHTLGVKEASVYKRSAPKSARIEYHGTSYRNLAKAAPDIDWPIPPHPYA